MSNQNENQKNQGENIKPEPNQKRHGRKKLSLYEEEKVQSPFRTIMRQFFTRKLTILGLSVFGFVALCSIILPYFFPNDTNFIDSTQVNLRPGFYYLNVPKEFASNAKLLSVGNNFSAGVDKNGKIYVWGNTDKYLKDIPQDMGNIVQLSCGLTQILALNDQGDVFTWGIDRFNLMTIPDSVKRANIVQVFAGDQLSVVLDDTGKIHYWGNENIISINTRDVTGKISKVVLNNATGLALLEDGTVTCLTRKDVPFTRIPQSRIDGRAVDIATNDSAAIALLDDGTVVAWGLNDYGLLNIPEGIQGKVTGIDGGRGHFAALLNDGTVVAWGYDKFGQATVPQDLTDVVFMEAGYYQSYAIDKNGKVSAWGLKGYLMGTDGSGRDVFRRLIIGGRTSLTVGAVAVIIASFIGIIIGSISGYFGGTVDVLLMRFAEVWSAIPFLPTAIVISYILAGKVGETGRVFITMMILGILTWPGMARLTRAQMLAARENEFVTAAKAMGVKTKTIIFRHIFPNILTVIAVSMALNLAGSILSESSLSFLGLGIVDPTPTWGNMLTRSLESANIIKNYWWRWVFPSIALGLAVLSLNVIGDGLREAIDPKSSGR